LGGVVDGGGGLKIFTPQGRRGGSSAEKRGGGNTGEKKLKRVLPREGDSSEKKLEGN